MLMLTSSIIFCWKEYLFTASYWIIFLTATSNSVVEDTVVQSLVQKYFAQFFCQNYLLHYYWDTWSFILFRRIHLKFKEEKPLYWIYWFSKADSEMIFNINFVFALNLFLSSKLLTLYQFWKKFCTEDNPCLSDDGRKCNGCWIYWKPVII